jgi:surface protein
LSFQTAPDYENPTDSGTDNQYVVRVRAGDGTLSDDQNISIVVTDVFENTTPGNLQNLYSYLWVMENQPIGTIVGEFNATDPDYGATLTYHLVSGAGDGNNSHFTLDSNGTLKTATIFDYESNASTYSVRVQAKDEYNATVEGNFPVTLTDVHEDSDGDGFRDSLEASTGSDLNDPNSTPLQQGLVAWYPFDGNSSDMSGNGRHGTVSGAVLAADRYGDASKSYSFSSGQKIIIHGTANWGVFVNDYTVSFWYQPNDDGSSTVGFFRQLLKNTASGFTLVNTENVGGWFQMHLGNSGSTSWERSKDVWTHFAISKQTGKFVFYIDNNVILDTSTIAKTSINSALEIGVGSRTSSSLFMRDDYANGQMDEFRIYNRALSPDEVEMIYRIEKPKVPLTNINFQTAVNLWFTDELNATMTYGHISDWNTSAVTNMFQAFKDRTDFNEDISGWDTSNVTSLKRTFKAAKAFNQDIGVWDVAKVTDMYEMFQGASDFNQPVGNWDVSAVTNMTSMFMNATAFNQPIGEWEVSAVTTMHAMFYGAHSFNQPIGSWDTSSVTSMTNMFLNIVLSDNNKGEIHKTFSSNPNWPYDWSEFMLNSTPSDLNSTTSLNISENQSIGTVVGEFNATDPDANASLTYHLVSGAGDGGNSLFILEANGTLKTATTFDYESNASAYSIRVQAKDEYNATVEGNFTVAVMDDQSEDTDGDGFTDYEELSAGTAINDANSTPGLDFGLVGYWPFDGNASDMSGNENHGTVHGASLSMDRHGLPSNAYAFDGIDDYIAFNIDSSDDLSFTWSFWLIDNSSSNDIRRWLTTRVVLNQTSTGGSPFIFREHNGRIEFTSNNGWKESPNANFWKDGNWHLVTLTANGLVAKVYLDGVYLVEDTCTLNPEHGLFAGGFYNGNPSRPEYFNGSMDDIRIYNRALSALEVEELYQWENLPPDLNATITGMVSYDGMIPGPAYVWANDANGTTVAEAILPDGNGSYSLSVHKGAGYDFKVFIDGSGDGFPQAYEVWKHIGEWNSTAGGFNLTQVDGNLSGVDFNLFDSDYDSDGFTNWQEHQAGTNQNDANSTPGLDFGLVAWYPLDGNASDMSGNGNHGTVNGATPVVDRHGAAGKSYAFDGVDDYIVTTGHKFEAQDSGAISLWFNDTSSAGSGGSILGSRRGYVGGDFLIGNHESGDGLRTIFWNAQQTGWEGWSSDVDLNVWNHYALTWQSGGTSVVRLNNSIVGQAVQSATIFGDNLLYIGSESFEYFSSFPLVHFHGSIDDIRIYDRTLSAAEVAALYQLENTPTPGMELWRFSAAGEYRSSPAIGFDGTVYVGSDDSRLYALDGNTGNKKWEFVAGGSILSTPAVGVDGTIYVGSDDNKLYALSDQNGTKKWEFVTGDKVRSSPAIGIDGTIYFGSYDDKLYALDPIDGSKKWEFDTGANIFSAPAIGSDGTIYFGNHEGKFFALNSQTGWMRWEFDADQEISSSPALSDDGTVYIGSHSGIFYALDGQNGNKKWEYVTGEGIYSSPVIGTDNTVYFGSGDNRFYALDGQTGEKKWDFLTNDIVGGPVAPTIGSDGVIYFGSFDMKVYALDGQSGVKLWDFSTASHNQTFAALSHNKILYISSRDKNLYAIQASSGPASSPWPTGGQNNQRTGLDQATVQLPNTNPTDLNSTAPLTIAENQPIGTIVGEFSATDPDANATLTYDLVSGAGDGNNSLFTLETNGTLKTATTFDYESNASTYVIFVQAKDEHNASVEGNFTVSLTNDPSDDVFVPVPITDANFQDAVNLWFSDELSATATYGHIRDWNTSAVTDMSKAFKDRSMFNEDISGWDVSNVNDMESMFFGASTFNMPVGGWDVSSVINMRDIFNRASSFNQPIGNWNVSAVTNMRGMFYRSPLFNQFIGDWNTSSVTSLNSIFEGASMFNKDISGWDVSSVTNMVAAFLNANNFNQDISDWNISAVTNIENPLPFNNNHALSSINKGLIHESFSSIPNWPLDWREFVSLDDTNFQTAVNLWFDNQAEANATYGHISDWNVSQVTDMSEAFKDRTTFDEDISAWDTSSVTNMEKIFYKAAAFNQPIGAWDVSSVGRMVDMFHKASVFNQPIGDWNVSSVYSMQGMFWLATSFNQPLGNWDVSSVRSLRSTFQWATSFDQDISGWDVSSVNNMRETFQFAHAFNQNLNDWNVSSVTSLHSSFRKSFSFDQDISSWNPRNDANMSQIFDETTALSDTNKGLIHESFSPNPSWPYDWSAFVPAPPTPDGNYTTPDDHFMTPDDGHHSPDEGHQSPDGLYSSPDEMHGTPDDFYQTPDTSLATPEDGYGSLDGNYTTPDEGHQSPDGSYQTPDMGQDTPDHGYGTPDANYTTPDYGYGSPDGKYITPDDHFIAPDDGHPSPDDSYHSPDTEIQTPDAGQSTPDHGYGPPDGNYTTPDDHFMTPDDVHHNPDEGHQSPDDLYGSPDDMHGTPDDFYQTPDTSLATPEDGYGSLDGNYTTPDEGHHSPDDSYQIPDMDQVTPDYGYGSPDGKYITPDDHFIAPDDGHPSPDDSYHSPDTEIQTPDTSLATPDHGYGSPDGNYTTPDDHFMTPDDGHHNPDEGHQSPDDLYDTPVDMHGTPDDFYQTSDTTLATPEDGYGSPDGNYTSPNDGHHNPDDSYQTPDMGQGTPDDGYGLPDGNYTTPDDHFMSPDEGHQSPDNLYGSPDMAEAELPNQPPVELNATAPLFIAENQALGTEIGKFFAYDPDGDTLTFMLVGESNESMDAFTIDPNGSLRSKRSFDFESDPPTFELSVSAMDQEGTAIESNFTVTLLDELEDLDGDAIEDAYDLDMDGDGYSNEEEEAYGSNPRDAQSVANAAPVFVGPMDLEVTENQPAGLSLGTVQAEDPDGPVALNLSLIGDDANRFSLEANGTLLTLQSFDYESDPKVFQLSVTVSDDRNASTAGMITVRVVNVIEDLDGDGFEDAFDSDLDGDGLSNLDEEFAGTDPWVADTDDDGLSDGDEVELGTFGLFEDSDEDGLADGTEIGIGTNPLLADTDGDGFEDEAEVLAGSFPEDANDYPGKQVVIERDPNEFGGMIYELSEQSFTLEEALEYAAAKDARIPYLERKNKDPLNQFLTQFLLRNSSKNARRVWILGKSAEWHGFSQRSLLTQRGVELSFIQKNLKLPVILVREKPEIRLPGVYTEYPEVNDGVVNAKGQLMDDGGETPFRIGFRLSEKITVRANDQSARMISASLSGLTFEAIIDRLQTGKTYYLRAFAENSAGLLHGSVRKIRLEKEYEAPFDAVALGQDWHRSVWFGTFQAYNSVQWIFHAEFGWLYHGPTNQNGIWFWKENEGWLWSRKDTWPYLWRYDSESWLYHFEDGVSGPLFWDYQSQSYLRW